MPITKHSMGLLTSHHILFSGARLSAHSLCKSQWGGAGAGRALTAAQSSTEHRVELLHRAGTVPASSRRSSLQRSCVLGAQGGLWLLPFLCPSHQVGFCSAIRICPSGKAPPAEGLRRAVARWAERGTGRKRSASRGAAESGWVFCWCE